MIVGSDDRQSVVDVAVAEPTDGDVHLVGQFVRRLVHRLERILATVDDAMKRNKHTHVMSHRVKRCGKRRGLSKRIKVPE